MIQNPDASHLPEHVRTDTVRVKLFGMPRVITGARQIEVRGPDLRSVLQSAVRTFPTLRSHVLDQDGSWLNGGYVFVVNGTFTSDPSHLVTPGDELLLVSRASGG